MMNDLMQKGIKHYHEINLAIDDNESWKHIRPYHVMVLTQNQIGYKNLFKVMSDALTTHFYNLLLSEHPEVRPLFNQAHQASGEQPGVDGAGAHCGAGEV